MGGLSVPAARLCGRAFSLNYCLHLFGISLTALLGGNAFVWSRNGLVHGLAAASEVLVFLPSRLFPACGTKVEIQEVGFTRLPLRGQNTLESFPDRQMPGSVL